GDTATGTQAKELLETTNGGRTWTSIASASIDQPAGSTPSVPLEGQLGGISMTTEGVGWLWTDRGLWTSRDSGRTWARMPFVSTDSSRVVVSATLLSATSGLTLVRDSVASQVSLELTRDSGLSWRIVDSWPFGHG